MKCMSPSSVAQRALALGNGRRGVPGRRIGQPDDTTLVVDAVPQPRARGDVVLPSTPPSIRLPSRSLSDFYASERSFGAVRRRCFASRQFPENRFSSSGTDNARLDSRRDAVLGGVIDVAAEFIVAMGSAASPYTHHPPPVP